MDSGGAEGAGRRGWEDVAGGARARRERKGKAPPRREERNEPVECE